MELWQAIILGIVQGLTEFLPISSSGHLVIFPWLFDWESGGLAFDAALHLGTLAAVLVYFQREIRGMVAAIPYALSRPLPILKGQSGETERDHNARLGMLIVIATIPGAIAGALFESQIDEFFHTEENSTRAIATIATMLIVVGIVLAIAERVAHQRKEIGCMKPLDALFIGLGQALALIPGTSRSGATITAGLFRNLKRGDAARFSFLAGMPLIAGAGAKALLDVISEGMSSSEVANFVAGGAAAAVVGFLTIWGLLRFLQSQSTMVFVVYRILFGLFLFAMLILR
jgi:undecaprenyl-diphosphatase